MQIFQDILHQLQQQGNYRRFPQETPGLIDFTSNDYLGLASMPHTPPTKEMTASASRLLALQQEEYRLFEHELEQAYSRPALLLNSGYHANVGVMQALAATGKKTLIVADRLVHASIIDGMRLAGCDFTRFRHNDMAHARKIIEAKAADYEMVIVVAESVYSMDGDSPDLSQFIALKSIADHVVLYLDEAHAVGVCGPNGLGLAAGHPQGRDIDIVVGTLGKALASLGAFVVVSDEALREYLINTCRSLIFSTALPPAVIAHSRQMFSQMMTMDAERQHLLALGRQLAQQLGAQPNLTGHIHYHITGSPESALALSNTLADNGIKVLPIRYPTVARGTERLRMSISARHTADDIVRLAQIINNEASKNRK